MGDLTEHYSTAELSCRDDCGYGAHPDDYAPEWLEFIETRRKLLDRPSVVTSGKRCGVHNMAVGGVPESAHMRDALDEKTDGGFQRWEAVLASIFAAAVQDQLLAFETAKTLVEGLRHAQIGIGIAKTFHHCDRDSLKPRPGVWKY